MIFTDILKILLSFPTAWLQVLRVDELPFGMDQYFSNGIGYFRRFIDVFPPFSIFLEVFIWYLLFKFAVVLLNLLLGHRSPSKHL
jgi:hypothetical protein